MMINVGRGFVISNGNRCHSNHLLNNNKLWLSMNFLMPRKSSKKEIFILKFFDGLRFFIISVYERSRFSCFIHKKCEPSAAVIDSVDVWTFLQGVWKNHAHCATECRESRTCISLKSYDYGHRQGRTEKNDETRVSETLLYVDETARIFQFLSVIPKLNFRAKSFFKVYFKSFAR